MYNLGGVLSPEGYYRGTLPLFNIYIPSIGYIYPFLTRFTTILSHLPELSYFFYIILPKMPSCTFIKSELFQA